MKTLWLTLALVLALAMPAAAQTLASGSIITNGQSVTASPGPSVDSVSIQITGTWTGTITFQGSTDGSTYVSLLMSSATAGTGATSTTSNGVFSAARAGLTSIRATATAAMTGTAVIRIQQGGSLGSGGGSGGGDATDASLQEIVTLLETSAANDVAHDAADTGNPVKIGGRADSTEPADVSADGDRVNAWFNPTGALATFATSSAYGGCTPGTSISAGAVLETEIKATAGTLYHLNVTSIDATPVYVKVYNDTAANTDETDTPVLRYGVPGSTDLAGHAVPMPPMGINFSTAITVRIVTGIADNSTGALTASEVLLSYCYR